MKAFLVDSATALVFFTLVAGVAELFVAGLAWDQVLASRAAAIPVMLLTGRPYGVWRDWIFALFGVAGRGPFARTAIDTLAFLTFQVPVYALILLFAGASLPQMAKAISTAVVLMVLLSRPYGLLLDLVRRVAGVQPPAPGR